MREATNIFEKTAITRFAARFIIVGLFFWTAALNCGAATLPGNADLTVSDPTGALSWNSSANALTIQCWFKISIPSGTNLTQNMVILANGTSGSESQYAYLIRFNISNGNIEFVAQGSSGGYTNTLIQLPYLERWYHLAIVQQGAAFTGYVDGRQVFSSSGNVGNTANTSGLSIGGWGNGQYFYGEIQEVSIYQNPLSQDFIVQNMYASQPNDSTLGLTGYFPISYSTNAANELTNFAPPPIANGTSTLAKQGNVTFEETDESGEQSTFDANRNGGRDALTPLSGAFSWQQTAFARPTPGIAFDFCFGYSSANSFGGFQLGSANPYSSGSMGNGWRNTFETRVIPAQTFSPLADVTVVGLMYWNGAVETWDADDVNAIIGSYHTRSAEYKGEMVLTATNCQWTTPERLVYYFNLPGSGSAVMRGRLTAIHDFNGNSVQILWNQTSGIVTQVVDSVGGIYKFNYQGNLLANITFGSWQVNFTYDATNRLVSKSITNTNTADFYANVNTTWQFGYNTNGLLSQIVDPRGNTNLLIQYDQYGRQTNQVDAIGRATATCYGMPADRQITRIDAATNSWVETYDRKGNLLAQQDPLGNVTSYTYDTNGNRISLTEPLGWTTTFGYDNRANVIAKTNALGEVTHWVFDSFFNKPLEKITPQPADANGWTTWTNFYVYDSGGNLISNYDALGSLVSYTYSTNGLVLSSTDADGHTTTFGYDTNGFQISKTDPATNTTTYTVNDVDWKLKETDALGDTTSYAYDLNGNPIRVQDAIGRIFTKTYDANGNLLSQSDGKGALTTFSYDAANQKTNMIDRTSTNQWKYFYTSRGKLDHVTDALGNSVTNVYDAANRLIQVIDPLGHAITNQYDANGNLTAFFDKTGQRWTKTYDRLNRVIAESDPLGDIKTTTYDVADRVQQITSPNGYPSVHTYDGRGRLIKWVDPQDFPWLYSYDGVGNITNIEDALHGHYIMAYDSRNERIMEKNQDGFVWRYFYNPMMWLTNQTDPNGTVRMPKYDPAGRVTEVDFSTGRQDSFILDENNNPKTVKRQSSGVTTTTQFIYDLLDRVVEQDVQDDTLGKTVLYGYDPLSRVTTITYPGNKTLTNSYDPLGRLTKQVDWAGRKTSYIYDLADRLISRTYPNGVVQTNSFDTAGRIVRLNYSPQIINSNSVNIALTYAYDRNGNKTGGGESGTLNWPQPSLTDEQSSFTPAGRLINRQITETSPSNSVNSIAYHYDASGNMTNAVGDGQSWTLTYDEDNRTTSINWDAGITAKFVTNRYDALGRRISKTVDGETTGYVLDLSGGMEKVLCDLDGNGNVTAYYVHGPDLCYRVDSTNGLLCYHADAQGNIIALTDGNTNLVAQYAYTPYGRSLGSTNFQSQISNPYLFVGSQGVQEESGIPNLYFMRARYYSADAGVFLSTDPVKKVGAGWQPIAYAYANGNPLRYIDSSGNWYIEWFPSDSWFSFAATVGNYGHSFELIDKPREATFYKASESASGLGVNLTIASLEFVEVNSGSPSDWENYKEASIPIGPVDLDYKWSQTGAKGISISASAGWGYGKVVTTHNSSDEQVVWDRRETGGLIVQPNSASQTKPSVNLGNSATLNTAVRDGSDGGSSMISGAVGAAGHAQTLNASQQTFSASYSSGSGTTTQTASAGSSQSSGGNAFTQTVNTITTAVNNAANSFAQTISNVGQTITNTATSVWNTVKGWF